MFACIALSLPLWQTRLSYPGVPLFDFIPPFPSPLDLLFLALFGVALVALGWRPRSRALAVFWFSAAAFLVVQDQSRLQPWFIANALLLAAIVFSSAEDEALSLCRLILVAIYFWSGVHKMNLSFVDALFPSLISSFGAPRLAVPLHYLGVVIPYLEMGLALALLFPRTRRAGVVAIVGLHVSLLAVLGLALGWNSVVWPWNLSLMILVPCLFWKSADSASAILTPKGAWVRKALFAFVIVLPPLSFAELSDTGLSFDLYSGNPLIGSVVVSPDALQRLDASPRSVAEQFGEGYIIRFGDWSLATTNVPAYPAERVLQRIAESFCAVHKQDNDVVFVVEKPARWLYRPGWHRIERSQELCSNASTR